MDLAFEARDVIGDGFVGQEKRCKTPVFAPEETSTTWLFEESSRDVPCLIIRSRRDTASHENDLGLHVHFLARGENRTIGDNEVLRYPGVGYHDKELVSKSHGVKWTEFLGPVIQSQFWVPREEREGAYANRW